MVMLQNLVSCNFIHFCKYGILHSQHIRDCPPPEVALVLPFADLAATLPVTHDVAVSTTPHVPAPVAAPATGTPL